MNVKRTAFSKKRCYASARLRVKRSAWTRKLKRGGVEAPPPRTIAVAALVLESTGWRRVKSAMLNPELYFCLRYYSATVCVPGVIITLFVIYVFLRDRNRWL
jgi:hypothetical protein